MHATTTTMHATATTMHATATHAPHCVAHVFHGLAAYRGGTSALATARKLRKLRTLHGEVCAADRPIGPVGVVLRAVVTGYFADDVYSWIADDGLRQSHAQADLCVPRDEAHLRDVCATDRTGKNAAHYSELWCVPLGVTAVWVHRKQPREVMRAAARLAERLGVPVFAVRQRSSIQSLPRAAMRAQYNDDYAAQWRAAEDVLAARAEQPVVTAAQALLASCRRVEALLREGCALACALRRAVGQPERELERQCRKAMYAFRDLYDEVIDRECELAEEANRRYSGQVTNCPLRHACGRVLYLRQILAELHSTRPVVYIAGVAY